MEPTDLTVKILQEIRDDNRGVKGELQGLRADITGLRIDINERFEKSDQRFLAIETTLKDLAEQMVMLARGIKSALEVRSGVERRLDDHEERLRAIERTPH